MAAILTDDALFGTVNPRKVGEALTWDVIKISRPDHTGRLVGKIVLRDGIMFARDNTACGEPMYLPRRYPTLGTMLRYASDYLFA